MLISGRYFFEKVGGQAYYRKKMRSSCFEKKASSKKPSMSFQFATTLQFGRPFFMSGHFINFFFRWSRRSQGHRSDGFRFELISQEPNHRLKVRNTISYAKIDDFGLFRCEHKRGPSGQVKFAITKRRTNDSFKSLSPLRGLTHKKKKYSDCKIFGKRVSFGGSKVAVIKTSKCIAIVPDIGHF